MNEQAFKGVAPIKTQFLVHTDVDLGKAADSSAEHTTETRKRKRGQNKRRPRDKKITVSTRLCPKIAVSKTCPLGESCKFSHSVDDYLSSKPQDIGETCYNFDTFGYCRFGHTCRFLSGHNSSEGNIDNSASTSTHEFMEKNHLTVETRTSLRKRTYDFEKAKRVSALEASSESSNQDGCNEADTSGLTKSNFNGPARKWKADFDPRGKLFLAPLTTVGNLPFRRICVEFGAEITCGEMAMADCLINGQQSEWALVQRHESEKCFGVQLCGNKPHILGMATQLLSEMTEVDFIDLNVGCPIDLVCDKGSGSALLTRQGRLEHILKTMNGVSNVPITLKTRIGFNDNKPIADKVALKLPRWGVNLFTLHGRSRQQRYTKLADWDYIEKCGLLTNSFGIPCFGCGDVLSFEDYNAAIARPGVDGIMFARGALIKPWIFTEVKEQRHWDISAQERLDIVKKYANYGLEHWGSDQQGVDRTRRFLLEWLSFLYRYIPVGLLERVPVKINERPPAYFGRNDLETLMASKNCQDWVRITEMFLGPVADDFQFLPKHKANAF